MATKMAKIKFLISLIQPDARKQLRVFQEALETYEAADRRLFPDTESLIQAIAGQLHESAGCPEFPASISFEMACARAIIAATPKAVKYPSEVSVGGKNRQLLEIAFIGANLPNAEFTTGDLAEFAGVSDAYIRAEIIAGRLAAQKLTDAANSPNLIEMDEARRWLKSPLRGSRSQ